MDRSVIIMILAMLCLSGAASAKSREKEQFNLLAQYRTDIPAEVIKKAKNEMDFDASFARIHDSWIEHPHGKSIDLQGNVLFPNMDYTYCKPVSPTHFELGKFNSSRSKYGVVRTDNTVIIPMDNFRLDYFPRYNIIIAYVDWDPSGYDVPKKGKLRIYSYYGDLLHEIDNVTSVGSYDLKYYSYKNAKVNVVTDSGTKELNFPLVRTDYEQDNITKFYSDGPQAVTYNIIRELCASNKKGDQKKALDLLDFYANHILPNDNFANESSSIIWDATIRYLACLNFTKEYSRLAFDNYDKEPSFHYRMRYAPGVPPTILKHPNPGLAQIPELAQQAESLLNLAVNELQQKQIRDEQRRQTWMAVLGVLANSLSATGGYTPLSGANYTSNTTTVPQINTGKTMLEQTSISPEIVGAAITAGWAPETSSSSSSSSTTTQHSSSSSKRVCHACFGKGQHQACNGSGTQLAFGNKRTEKCSGCHGSGKCPQCGGTGYH